MKISVVKYLAHFNLASNSKDWMVEICAHGGVPSRMRVSELWPEDDEPDVEEDTPPSVIIERISERLESYIYKTSRDDTREKLKWFRENMEKIEKAWAQSRIDKLRSEVASKNKEIEYLARDYLSREPIMDDKAA